MSTTNQTPLEQIKAALAELAVREMKYQAMRTYGTKEEALKSEPFPWLLVFGAYDKLEDGT